VLYAWLSKIAVKLLASDMGIQGAVRKREEIERMFGLSELRQTKVYQEAFQKGRQEGEKIGEQGD
jgi:predicted transposase YdaD